MAAEDGFPAIPSVCPQNRDLLMKYREICILLPCHSLEDFPMHYDGAEADGLLAAWTALWHPWLLATTGAAPTWYRSATPPEDFFDRLILVPSVSRHELPPGYAERAESDGARLIAGDLPRDEILERALPPLAGDEPERDGELAADFLALGYTYLQVELLTRQMRYSTNLDEIHFNRQAVAGAEAWLSGDDPLAREKLTACFDLLAEERDHYYAVDAYVLDLTLLAPSTLGRDLQRQIDPAVPVNLLLDSDLIQQLESRAPESLRAIQKGLQAGYVGLVSGTDGTSRPLLESAETMRQRLEISQRQFEQTLGQRPQVFGTRRFCFSPLQPQLLRQFGFSGAFHVGLGDGRVPTGSQIKIRWEAMDHSSLDAVAKNLADASEPGTFLGYASRLGETMDMDHVATVCLAHWPGRVCTWYHDLRRAARYGAMLGRFMTAEEYFRETDYPGQLERFRADQYRSAHLQESCRQQAPDPISTVVRYWRRRALLDAARTLETVAALMGDSSPPMPQSLVQEVDLSSSGAANEPLDQRLQQHLDSAADRFSQRIPRRSDPSLPGCLVINPVCAPRRVMLRLSQLDRLPAMEPPIYAACSADSEQFVVVDLPPLGFAYVAGGDESANKPPSGRGGWVSKVWGGRRGRRSAGRGPATLTEENRLFNDYFQVTIHPETGGIQSLIQYDKRGNCLSQQLAVRNPIQTGPGTSGQQPVYSTMVADRLETTDATSVFAEITARGRLVGERQQTLATFCQRFQVWRGSRVLRLSIELEPQTELESNPWNSYFACRFAWGSESASIWRAVGQMRATGEAKQLEAPSYIEIDDAGKQTTLLTGGLPYHRRTTRRMLDSLLIVRGETARQFELGIGVGLKYPLQESVHFLTPTPVVPATTGPPQGNATSWLFHLQSRNIHATDWSPLVADQQVQGVRVRLLETSGRPAKGMLRGFRPFTSARRVDFQGDNMGTVTVKDDGVFLELGENEWVEVEARW
jgi:alpha-mannosidase